VTYTVHAVNPYFLFVLLPRRSKTPTPDARRVAAKDEAGRERPGVHLFWPGGIEDLILFGTPDAAWREDGVLFSAAAVFLRFRGDQVLRWGLFDGQRLIRQDRPLVIKPQRTVAVGPPS